MARLFDAAVQIPELEEADRRRIWRHHLGRQGIGKAIGKKKIAELAKSYPVDAGAIARAAEALAEIARASGKPVSRTALPAVEAMLGRFSRFGFSELRFGYRGRGTVSRSGFVTA